VERFRGDPEGLPRAARQILDAAVGSAELDGGTIPDSHRRLPAAFLAGQIDATEYRAEARRLVIQESLDLDR
jgi:Antitoxin VbhA